MNATDILKRSGLKKSAQRIAIINILQNHLVPLKEDEIKDEMGEIYDRITFYRT
ncbi:MAG TPA: Fur family transcriptional regulator, partial [Rikenellaceae bacterium]|nr:Fur family transcriptional regulator [Rikenellaceae bacterium]